MSQMSKNYYLLGILGLFLLATLASGITLAVISAERTDILSPVGVRQLLVSIQVRI